VSFNHVPCWFRPSASHFVGRPMMMMTAPARTLLLLVGGGGRLGAQSDPK
jgi:hypothetical protein